MIFQNGGLLNQHQLKFARHSRGASLIMVLLILVIVSMLGIAGIQVSMMGERGARNDRDFQVAWQSAETALLDAEFDMIGSVGVAAARPIFDGLDATKFAQNGCGTSGDSRGLCKSVTSGKPVWLTANFDDTSASSDTVAFGTFTNHSFASGSTGVQPARAPRYIIERVNDTMGSKTIEANQPEGLFAYRVTAMGYGPRTDIQAVVQTLFRN